MSHARLLKLKTGQFAQARAVTNMTDPENLFANIPTDLPDELVETLVDASSVRVERIVSTGHTSPADFWYDQPQNECVVVLRGEARLLFEDEREPIEMKPGDFVNIPAHKKHRVEWTTPSEPTVWLAIHYD